MILDLTPKEVKILRSIVKIRKSFISVSAQFYDDGVFNDVRYKHASEECKILVELLKKLDKELVSL